MDAVSLNQRVRFNLQQLQQNEALRLQTAERLATGRRVNRVADDPKDFFTAQALSNRIGDLISSRTNIGQGQSAVTAAADGLRAVESLTRQLRGIANAARGGSVEQRQAAAEQFDEIRNQITVLANDASFAGTSLISDPAESLSVPVGDLSGARVTVGGQPSTASGLGLGAAAGNFNNFASDADIDAALANAENATRAVRSIQARFGSDQATLTTRGRFAGNLSGTLQAAEGRATSADLNEEAARRLALQLQDQLGQGALRFAVRTDRLVVDLLGAVDR